jgi:hypothetical protein
MPRRRQGTTSGPAPSAGAYATAASAGDFPVLHNAAQFDSHAAGIFLWSIVFISSV